MDNRLTTISTIYNQFQTRQVKFSQLIIKSELVNYINTCYATIRNHLGSNIKHTNLEYLDYDIRSMLFKYNLSLIPMYEHLDEAEFQNKLHIINEEFKPFLANHEVLNLFTTNLSQLYSLHSHIYLNALSTIIKYGPFKYTIVTKYKLSVKEQSLITSYFKNFKLNFITALEYNKNLTLHDIVIFIGSPNIFQANVLEHINATHFYFVYFDLYHRPLKFIPWIDHPRISRNDVKPIFQESFFEDKNEAIHLNKLVKTEESDEIVDEKLLLEPQIPDVVLNSFIHSTTMSNDKNIECKLIELENGQFIFEEIGKKAKCDTIDQNYSYVRKHLDDIEIEDFLIIIQFNTWSDRKKFADLYFEKEGILEDRKNVAKLKEYLCEKINKYGLERYTDHLNKKLHLSLKYYQINGLTKEESFHLRDKQSFYKLLTYFTKNETNAKKFYKSCFSLANFHQRIGHMARKELRDFLKKNPRALLEIQDENQLTIPNIEYLKIDFFKIKNISTQIYKVPSSKVGTLIKLKYEEVY